MGEEGDHPNKRHDDQTPYLRLPGLYLGVDCELPGTLVGGLVVGYFLDQHLGKSPWLLIACTGFAFAGAFVRLVRWARFFARERNGNRSEKDDTAH